MERFVLKGIAELLVWLLLAPFKLIAWIFSPKKPAKYINSNGYVVFREFNELEHRYIAMKLIGRNLHQNEVVHHINGGKTDNSVNNLCLMDREKHEHFHSWLRWKKEKSGSYPSFSNQKRALVAEYNGTLLEKIDPPKVELKKAEQSEADITNHNGGSAHQKKLFVELKKERKRLADENDVVAYLIFHDKTLIEMANTMPTTETLMLQVSGVGPEKMRKYGQLFINIIKAFKLSIDEESA